ncbi:MAG: DUF2914 domain-containing protein [Balneolaceae bacterium]|nr:DUF2914 domain-containing protein [Balneolaceae bacterium]
MKKLALTSFLILFLVTGTLSAQDLSVETIEIGTAVENRSIVGADSTFAPNVENLFCFTKVTGAQDTTEIYHVWFYKDEEKARTPLTIKSKDWRTWSSKTILDSWTGAWRVAVEDQNGNILAEKSFMVSEEN